MSEDKAVLPVRDLDTVYLSYDEPQREEFWVKIRSQIPWAKRVDGVRGSDAAHKAAADASETERFIVIDGDNLPDWNFWDQNLVIDSGNQGAQFRWRARNNVNGLYYGNGGLSCWTREYVWNMRTHEHSLGDAATSIEFCFDRQYWPMHDCWSITYPNYSAKQAWRAGFREGVKLCTRHGEVNKSASDFCNWVWPKNLQTLRSWYTLGSDVENGIWAQWGARWGTYYLMLQDWDYRLVQDFAALDELWLKHQHDDSDCIQQITAELNQILKLDIVDFTAEQSAHIKRHYGATWRNEGIMVTELEVIKRREGW